MAKNQRTEVQVGDKVITEKGTKGTLESMSRHPLTRKPVAMFINTGGKDLKAVNPKSTRRDFKA